jgi:hypothetical protein
MRMGERKKLETGRGPRRFISAIGGIGIIRLGLMNGALLGQSAMMEVSLSR